MTVTDLAATDQRDSSRLELLYHISREIASRLDLANLLSRILHLTAESVGAVNASLVVLDEQGKVSYGALLFNGRVIGNAAEQLTPYVERGLAGWVARHKEGVTVANAEDDPRWYVLPSAPPAGPKAVVAVPLSWRDQVVGVLTLVHTLPGYFGEGDLALLKAIADQAAIAIDNARLFAAEQRRRALSDTLQQVSRTINQTLDLDSVLPLILEQLGRVIRSDSSAILLRDTTGGNHLRVVAARGFKEPAAMLNQTFSASGVAFRVVNQRRPIVIDDVRQEPDWIEGNTAEQRLIRTWIGAPLMVKGDVIGVLTVDSYVPGSYSEEDGRVVAAFAEQAATAVVNARLYEEIRKQAQTMAALAETAQAVASTLDLDEVLRLLLSRVAIALSVEAVSIALVQDDQLEFKVAEGVASQGVVGMKLKLGQGIAGWVAKSGRPVLVPEVKSDPRFFGEVDLMIGFVTRSIICAPITVNDRVIGVIQALNPRRGNFNVDDLNLLSGIAEMASNAIAHAQLFVDIQAAEARYAALFEDSIDPILITDLSGQITDVNRKAVDFLGYTREEIRRLSIGAVHRMGTGPVGTERFRSIAAGKEVSFETRASAQDGREVPVEVHAKRIVQGGQEFIQWIEHDISERLQLEEMRSDMVSMIFHDLRSPLANIMSSLEVLEASLPPNDEALASVLAIAVRSSQRLSRLVDSLLDVRRLESGKAVLHRENASINALIAEAAEQVHPVADGKGIVLRLDAPPRLPSINVDADMIRRVVINLVENGVKYTDAGGTVTVSAKADDEAITVSVKDTGPGIPASEHTRIFTRFARIYRDGAPKGLGLGLAFCKLAVEAHGGKIWVESEPGQGATFSFTVPLNG